MRAVTALWHSPVRASSPGHSPHWCFDKVTLIQLFSHSGQTLVSEASLTAFLCPVCCVVLPQPLSGEEHFAALML